MWAAPEVDDPVLLHAPTRKSTACFGAVCLGSGQFVWSMATRFDALTFKAFLHKLIRHRRRGRRMVVVLDNAAYHHARLLRPFLRKHRRVLTLLFLPPYRAGVEVGAQARDSQPLLRQARRSRRGGGSLLHAVAKTE